MPNNREMSDNSDQDDGPLIWLAFYSEEAGREYYYEPKRQIATWIMPDSYHPYPKTKETSLHGEDKDEQDQRSNIPKTTRKIIQRGVSFSSEAQGNDGRDNDNIVDERQSKCNRDVFSDESDQKSRGLNFFSCRNLRVVDDVAGQNVRSRWTSSLPRRFLNTTLIILVIILGGVVIIVLRQEKSVLKSAFLANIDRHSAIKVKTSTSMPSPITASINAQRTGKSHVSDQDPINLERHTQYSLNETREENKKIREDVPADVEISMDSLVGPKSDIEKNQLTASPKEEESVKPYAEQRKEGPRVTSQNMLTDDLPASQESRDVTNEKGAFPASSKHVSEFDHQQNHNSKQENILSQKDLVEQKESTTSNNNTNSECDEENGVRILTLEGNAKSSRPTKKAAKQSKKCLVPLAYLISPKCRRQARENPLFDLQNLVDSLME